MLIFAGVAVGGAVTVALLGVTLWLLTTDRDKATAVADAGSSVASESATPAPEEVTHESVPGSVAEEAEPWPNEPADASAENEHDIAESETDVPEMNEPGESESDDPPQSNPMTLLNESGAVVAQTPKPTRHPDAVVKRPHPRQTALARIPQEDRFVLGSEPFDAQTVDFDGPGNVIETPESIRLAALAKSTGDLAVQLSRGIYVLKERFFQGDTTAVTGPVMWPEMKGSPYICLKRFRGIEYLLVSGPSKIWVLDPETLQEARPGVATFFDMRHPRFDHVSNTDPKSLLLMTSNDENDPLVYCGVNVDSTSFTTINLESGLVEFSSEHHLDPFNIVGQYDGSTAKDPHGRIANQLTLEPDPEDEVQIRRKGAVTPLRFPPDRSWFVARDLYKLHFLDRTERTSMTHLFFPGGLQATDPKAGSTPPTRTFYDATRNRLLFLTYARREKPRSRGYGMYSFWALPIDAVELPDRPLLAIRPEFPRAPEPLAPGIAHAISLGVTDPRVKVSLMLGPDGATVKDNHLEWQPTADDVGIVKFQFKITEEGSTRAEIHHDTCRVGIPPYPIGFRGREARIASDGEHAILWSNEIEDDGHVERFRRGGIALVRTSDRVVVHDDLISMKLKDAALTSEFAVLAGLDGYSIRVHRLSDFELVARHNLTSEVTDIETLAGNLILASRTARPLANDSDRPEHLHILNLPDLEPTDIHDVVDGPGAKMNSVRPVGMDWRIGNAVVDSTLSKPLTLHSLAWSGIRQLNKSGVAATGSAPASYGSMTSGAVRHWVPPFFRAPTQRNVSKPESIWIGDAMYSVKSEALPNLLREHIVRLDSTAGPFGEQSLKVISYFWSGPGPKIMHAADMTLIAANWQLYTFQLSDLGIDAQPSPAEDVIVRCDSLISSLSTQRPTSIQLQITGGVPPYKIESTVAIPDRSRVRGQVPEIVKTTANSIRVDGKKLVETVFNKQRNEFGHRYFFGSGYDPNRNHVEMLKTYVQHVRSNLEPYLSTPIRGIPVCFMIDIKVTDAEGRATMIGHPMVFDYPGKELLAYAKAEDESRKKIEESREKAARAAALAARNRNPSQGETLRALSSSHPFARPLRRPHPRLPVVWNITSPLEFSFHLRRMWPLANYETQELKVDGLAATVVLGESKMKQPIAADLAWESRDAAKHRGVLTQVLDGHLQFKRGSNPNIVPLHSLSNESAVRAFNALRADLVGLEIQERIGRNEPESFRRINMVNNNIGRGIDGFQRDFGCLPPRAIVDNTGAPLLSWRVTLLPYLGYEQLFALFRLDEPWNSEHNEKLIPFMPPIYAGTLVKKTEQGKATIQAIVGDDTWFPVDGLRFTSDFIQPYRYTISHVESRPEHAVVWTAPEDLRLDDPGLMSKIFVKTEKGVYRKGRQQPDVRLFHAIGGEGMLLKLPFDEAALVATATIGVDGRSVFSFIKPY